MIQSDYDDCDDDDGDFDVDDDDDGDKNYEVPFRKRVKDMVIMIQSDYDDCDDDDGDFDVDDDDDGGDTKGPGTSWEEGQGDTGLLFCAPPGVVIITIIIVIITKITGSCGSSTSPA